MLQGEEDKSERNVNELIIAELVLTYLPVKDYHFPITFRTWIFQNFVHSIYLLLLKEVTFGMNQHKFRRKSGKCAVSYSII